MYHALVARLCRRTFDLVNAHDYDAILARCVLTIHHRFGGDHALRGERHDSAALRLWFERLGRLVPDLRLEVRDVWVKGWPWNTTAIIRWTGSAAFPDGSPYRQHGVHVVSLRWGRVTAIDANEDSQAVERMLSALAAGGVAEAAAPPITSGKMQGGPGPTTPGVSSRG